MAKNTSERRSNLERVCNLTALKKKFEECGVYIFWIEKISFITLSLLMRNVWRDIKERRNNEKGKKKVSNVLHEHGAMERPVMCTNHRMTTAWKHS